MHFEIMEEFLAMESRNVKTWGEDMYGSVSGVIKRHKLPWSALTNFTTNGLSIPTRK